MTIQEALTRVKNFRDRYKEWAEKDDTDVNVEALQVLISHAEQFLLNKKRVKKMKDCKTCKHRDAQYRVHGECKLRDEGNKICNNYEMSILKLAEHICRQGDYA